MWDLSAFLIPVVVVLVYHAFVCWNKEPEPETPKLQLRRNIWRKRHGRKSPVSYAVTPVYAKLKTSPKDGEIWPGFARVYPRSIFPGPTSPLTTQEDSDAARTMAQNLAGKFRSRLTGWEKSFLDDVNNTERILTTKQVSKVQEIGRQNQMGNTLG